jgi:hypothetical protein
MAVPGRSLPLYENEMTEKLYQIQCCRRNLEGQTFRKRRQEQPECSNGIRNRGLKERLRMGSRTTLGRIFWKTVEVEVARQIIGTSIRLRKLII